MQLDDALTQIAEIRLQLAKSEVFSGYRSAPVAASGVLALAGAAVQSSFVPDPSAAIGDYLLLWIGVAALSFALTASEIVFRLLVDRSAARRASTRLAVEQFLPCVAAGALVTFVIARYVPEHAALLPGLWMVLFGLGVFASSRLLPQPIVWVAVFYLAAGGAALVASRDGAALGGWWMGLTFGIGQLAAAAILYWTLERRR